MSKSPTTQGLTRRTCLAGMAAAGLGPTSGLAATDNELHHEIAEYARGLPAPNHGSLRILIPSGSGDNLAPVISAFTKLTGIPVRLEEVQVRDVATALLLDKLLDEAKYDVALPATFDVPDLVAGDAIQSLDMFDAARAAYRDEHDLLYSEGDSFDGKIYGYQTDGDVYMMFYNRRFFKDKKLTGSYEDRFGEAFTQPTDWATLDRQILHISGLGDGRKGALFSRATGYVEWEWWLRFHARGVWPMSPSLSAQFSGEDGVAVLEDMMRIGPAIAAERGGLNGLVLRWEDFENGSIYSTLSWGGSQKFHMRPGGPIANDLVHGLIPGGSGPQTPDALPYFNWGWSYSVPSGTRDAELAHAFCLFAVTPEMSLRAVRRGEGFFDPFRAEHYEDRVVQEIYSKPFLKTHRISMERAMPDFYLADRAAYFDSLSNWIGLALNDHLSPKEAMRHVADEWNFISESGDKDRKVRQWQALRAKYPVDIADYLRDLTA